jgi:hypothetical protein
MRSTIATAKHRARKRATTVSRAKPGRRRGEPAKTWDDRRGAVGCISGCFQAIVAYARRYRWYCSVECRLDRYDHICKLVNETDPEERADLAAAITALERQLAESTPSSVVDLSHSSVGAVTMGDIVGGDLAKDQRRHTA